MEKNVPCVRHIDFGYVDFAIMQDGRVFNVIRATWHDVETLAKFSSLTRANAFLNEFLSIE